MRYLRHETERLLDQVIANRDHITGCGDVFKLEKILKQHFGKQHALAVSSATSGITAIAYAADLHDAEVIASPLSWGGSLAALGLLGNTMVLAGVESRTLNLDPESLPLCLSPRTRAVLSTDQGGTAADHESIAAFCRAHGLLYISDSACSMGAYDAQGRAAGSLADVTVVSFTQGKGITAGEGAAIVTEHAHIHDRLLQASQHPERQGKELGSFAASEFAPLNARIHPFAATLLVNSFEQQMDRLKDKQQRMSNFLARHSEELGIEASLYSAHPRISTYFDTHLPVDLSKLPAELEGAITYPRPVTTKLMGAYPVSFRVPSPLEPHLEELQATPYIRLNLLLELHPEWQYC
ncbi:MAG: DegT/DnrJ/EryC1/StrS family aminotransferase [Flavobacteriales bacterium]|nr:DegT/DnrJ/EryC1/StrS family aminotransferase [Flavobacteriales bacterium]